MRGEREKLKSRHKKSELGAQNFFPLLRGNLSGNLKSMLDRSLGPVA